MKLKILILLYIMACLYKLNNYMVDKNIEFKSNWNIVVQAQ